MRLIVGFLLVVAIPIAQGVGTSQRYDFADPLNGCQLGPGTGGSQSRYLCFDVVPGSTVHISVAEEGALAQQIQEGIALRVYGVAAGSRTDLCTKGDVTVGPASQTITIRLVQGLTDGFCPGPTQFSPAFQGTVTVG